MLRILRQTGGGAIAVTDEALEAAAREVTRETGVDMSPEGGAAVAAVAQLRRDGTVAAGERVLLCNTGAGWL
jgi:threonine synthase